MPFVDLGVRPSAFGDAPDRNVPIRYHPYQTIILADGQGARVDFHHCFRSFPDRLVRIGHVNVRRHYLRNVHMLVSLLEFSPSERSESRSRILTSRPAREPSVIAIRLGTVQLADAIAPAEAV
jgi:hypothetical protein